MPEILIILEEGNEMCDEQLIMHYDLKTAMLNGPHYYKKNQTPYKIEEFLPKHLVSRFKHEVKPEDQARLIEARGNALAATCKQYHKG